MTDEPWFRNPIHSSLGVTNQDVAEKYLERGLDLICWPCLAKPYAPVFVGFP